MSVPELCNYRWPAEWELHSATWLAWPVNPETWPGIFEVIPAAFANFVAAIAQFEPVNILANADTHETARRLVERECDRVSATFDVIFRDIAVNDSWCRDYGPVFLNRQAEGSNDPPQVILNPRYNAWGGKYPPWDLDAAATEQIAEQLNMPCIPANLVLEGGAIEGNGGDTLLTTRSCVLNPNRNESPQQQNIERALRNYLQVERICWLPGNGIVGDDTDGHIDQIARFANRDTLLLASAFSPDAPEAADLRANHKALLEFSECHALAWNILPMRLPAPIYQGSHRVPASYCNFYICNGAVIMPAFDDPADDLAAEVLQAAFPDRQILGVKSTELAWGLGSFHCLTQQQPAPPVT